jgi:predicted transcriptional regulator
LKYRSRPEIIAEMLQSAVGGATKTRLMYGAFLSHNQMMEYLKFLLDKNMIAQIGDGNRYAPTEKGLQFLRMYDSIKDSTAVKRT